MRQRGIAFVKRDVGKDPSARREYERYKVKGVPFILVGQQTMLGFNAQKFDSLYRGHGTAQAAAIPATAEAAATAHASFSRGETLVGKIPGVQLRAAPTSNAPTVLRLAPGDAVVHAGEEREGFSRLIAAAGEGWVETLLLKKH